MADEASDGGRATTLRGSLASENRSQDCSRDGRELAQRLELAEKEKLGNAAHEGRVGARHGLFRRLTGARYLEPKGMSIYTLWFEV